MIQVIRPFIFGTALFVAWCVAAHADDVVRLYAGVAAGGQNHRDVEIHRVHREPYDARAYRRVPRRDNFFGHRSGRTPGSIDRPDPVAETRRDRDAADRDRLYRDRARPSPRVLVILIAPKPSVLFPRPRSQYIDPPQPGPAGVE